MESNTFSFWGAGDTLFHDLTARCLLYNDLLNCYITSLYCAIVHNKTYMKSKKESISLRGLAHLDRKGLWAAATVGRTVAAA